MPRREMVQALTLSRRSVGEADRLVTFFTREHGLLRVLAKGVRRMPSRRGGHLEPLTRVAALVTESRDRYFLAAIETQDYLPALHADQEALAAAQVLAGAAAGLFERGVAYPYVYRMMRQAWELLAHLPRRRRCLLEVATLALILEEAGVMPQLAACQQCGQAAPREPILLDPERGGWACLACSPVLTGASGRSAVPAEDISLSPQGLSLFRLLSAEPRQALQLAVAEEESWQLARTARYYVGQTALMPAAYFGVH